MMKKELKMQNYENNITRNYKGIMSVMLISLIVDQWNVFLIPQTNVFVRTYFHLDNFSFGLVTAVVIGGAAIGSLIGGYLTDKFGRKIIFQADMIVFIVAAIASTFSPDFTFFILTRFIAGIAVGADIANVYAYIMESSVTGKREFTGAMNTLMASFSILSINFIVLYLIYINEAQDIIWKYPLILSVLPASIGLIQSLRISETGLWKEISVRDETGKKKVSDILADGIKRKTTVFTWISGIASTIEVGTFAFFIPQIIMNLNISTPLSRELIIIGIYAFGIPSGYLGPKLLPLMGLRKLSYIGYIITVVSLILSGVFIMEKQYILVPVSMVMFVWGNHWNSQPILTSQALVSHTEYRGRSVGITNFISELPAFLSITFFPSLVSYIGLGKSTLLVALAPVAGLLAALYIFREIYGYTDDLKIYGIPAMETT